MHHGWNTSKVRDIRRRMSRTNQSRHRQRTPEKKVKQNDIFASSSNSRLVVAFLSIINTCQYHWDIEGLTVIISAGSNVFFTRSKI